MARLIDADAFVTEMSNRIEEAIKWGANGNEEIRVRAEQTVAAFCEASLTAKKLPTIEAEPVKHGRWIWCGGNLYECSECEAIVVAQDYIPIELHLFCRGCGAKMEV